MQLFWCGTCGRWCSEDRPMTLLRVLLATATLVAGLSVRPAHAQLNPAAPKPRLDRYGDPLPPGAVARLGSVRMPFHLLAGQPIAVSPDRTRLITFSEALGTVFVWDAATGAHAAELPLPNGGVPSQLAIGATGKWIAAISGNSDLLTVWNVETAEWLYEISAKKDALAAVGFTDGGKMLLRIERD